MGEVARQAPAQAELRPTMHSSFNGRDQSIGDDIMGEATRQAPAQAELRPTSAGAFRAHPALRCDPVHAFFSQLVDQIYRG
jgi:hypothetical protein